MMDMAEDRDDREVVVITYNFVTLRHARSLDLSRSDATRLRWGNPVPLDRQDVYSGSLGATLQNSINFAFIAGSLNV